MFRLACVAIVLALSAGCGGVWPPPEPAVDDDGPVVVEPPRRWVAVVGAAHDELTPQAEALTRATVRMILRPTASGSALRIRLDNRMSGAPVEIGGVSVGVRATGAAVLAGSLRRVTFDGALAVTLPAAAGATSDPVDLEVVAGAELAVSVYLSGAGVRPSGQRDARVTSYRTADDAGDAVGDESGDPFVATTVRLLVVTGVDVLAVAPGAIVALGSSSTAGFGSTRDGYDGWTDRLADRLAGRPPAGRHAVVNAGIGGNTLLDWPSAPGTGPSGLARLDADALDLAGVTHLVLFHGSNDVARGASASQVIAGLESALARAAERGVLVIGATIGPRRYASPAAMHAVRRAVNDWIRAAGAYHGVVDFDAVLRDPADPDRIRAEYDLGDGTHPSVAGYAAMAEAIDLELFGLPEAAP